MRARNRIPHCTTFWMVALLLFTTRGLSAQTSVVVQIDAGANRHAISPLIYGLNYAGANALSDLRCPLQRLGGNNLSRYNWQINADNKGSDYFFESIGDASSVPAARYDNFVALNQAAGAASMVTIPFVGWVAKLGSNRAPLAGFSVAKYGVQTGFDWQYLLNAGNGIGCDGNPIKSNDPNDADVPSDVAFQQGLVQHLLNGWGTAANGGVAYYLMDNEPSLWHLTHRDVHPIGETMDELYSKTESYAAMIKALDPTAMVAGPEEWGWTGYFNSGYDQQTGGHTDRDAHGGMDVIPWLLQQMQQYDQANGQSLLDILSLHYYPQGGEFSEDYTLATQLLRNRSTRSLWDPTYRDESWIDDYVQLIPRMKSWATTYYPGTLSAITEYNWGAESHINGATTQADLLGIFGREGLDMATRWATPGASSPVRSAIQIYRNYDGAGSAFGDTSVQATVPNPDSLSAFAAVRSSDGALTVMVINKDPQNETPVSLQMANFTPDAAAQVWQLTSLNQIVRLGDVNLTGTTLGTSAPAQSITLFVVPAVASAPHSVTLDPTGLIGGNSAVGTVTLSSPAPPGGAIVTLSSSDPSAVVPTSVTVLEGQTTAIFPVVTLAVPITTRPQITGTYLGVARTAILTLWSAELGYVAASPTAIVGGSFANATVVLNVPAPSGGAVIALSADNTAAILPPTVTIPAGALSAAFTVNSSAVTANTSVNISALYDGALQTTSLTIKTPNVSTVKLKPALLVGGNSSAGQVLLSGPAPAGGLVIALSSSKTSVAQVPSSVTVPEGATKAAFPVTTSAVSSCTAVLIQASRGGSPTTSILVVQPPALQLTVKPSSVTGGASSVGKVTLNSAAPPGGALVMLTSDSPAAIVPAGVTVAAGSKTASFSITTTGVAAVTAAHITAAYNGSSGTATLTIQPPTLSSLKLKPTSVKGGKSATGTIKLNGPAGVGGAVVTIVSGDTTVVQVPESVTVVEGATMATFTVTTSSVQAKTPVVLSASYGSGTKTATLTVKP